MMKNFYISLLLLSLFASIALAERPLTFAELWNNVSYYETNLDRKGFSSLLAHYEGKLGYNLFGSPWQAYGVYYGTLSQDSAYYNNVIYYGLGLRVKPFETYQGSAWYNEWVRSIKLFAETLNSKYIIGAASAEAAGLSTNDSRFGLEVWHEWNLDNPVESLPWGELWLNLSYRGGNFGWEPFNNYILYFQPKVGRHLSQGVELYLRGDLTLSGKEGASYYFLHMADYGAGIRFEPWRKDGQLNDLLRKFKMFAEVLSVNYLADKPAGNKQVSTDVRFGIDFSYGR